MRELVGEADIVVIDAPPILIVSDAYPLAAAADIVVAVVRNGTSTRADTAALRRTLDRLQVRRLDLVVTDSDPAHTDIYDSRYRPLSRVASHGSRARSRSDTP